MALRSLERVLAQGELTQEQLIERQEALEAERSVPLFLLGIRGERAGNDHLLTNVETGKLRLLETLSNMGRQRKDQESGWWDRVNEFFAMSMVFRSHVTLLRAETAMAEAAQLPAEQRYRALAEINGHFLAQATPHDRSQIMAWLLLPAVTKVAEAEQRVHLQLACAVVGLAAERYRLQYDQWPRSLDELVRVGVLQAIPVDSFDGKPLRLQRTDDGLVIYSVRKSGGYDGHALDRLEDYDPAGPRLEFRLWDPVHRRNVAPAAESGVR